MTVNKIYIEIKKYEKRIAEYRREIINFENKYSELKNIICEYLSVQEMLFFQSVMMKQVGSLMNT